MIAKKNILKICALAATTLFSMQSIAAIQLSNTRVVIEGSKNSGSVVAKNISSEPFVIQNWVEGPNEEMETPFFVTPPLSRLEGNTDFSLNIRKIDGDLPSDRESYFWLNVMEIPKSEKEDSNNLTLAIRTRIKIFYRPTGIGSPTEVEKTLDWALIRNGSTCQLTVSNGSAFNVNFSDILIDSKSTEFGKGYISAPFSQQTVDLKSCPTTGQLQANIVNDYGAFIQLPIVQLK
ncbi:molecular chaperone [Alcaligenaceae bacterium 429]|nr:molecular chaperone [Alcaligenaceae bacterium 429]